MRMEYRNTKTGATVTSPCKIKGGDWVEVESPNPAPTKNGKKSSKG